MPYEIKKVNGGFKVCKKDEPEKCFSKKPLTKETATKQRIAIIISEHSRSQSTGKTSTKPKSRV